MSFIDTSIIIYILCGILIFLVIWIIHLQLKVSKFTQGKSGRSLEDSMVAIKKGHDELVDFKNEMETYLASVEKRLKRSMQSIETVKFNPFKGDGSGGNQSFATVFLNEIGDGLVISSIYSRDRVSIYSKPIKKFTSEFKLSDEEKKVLGDANKKLSI